ncbi:uncharacterized protein FMAN_11095 [Fusarium mangiferae]|uniref:Uncharacterized protein n=1 Tax=Fusarium mangiferae TaxID=192010 RepID=A0A1L7TPQ5_FUSMA|nr:uncharacterized protein FMAN_11095 [Fusarium mangiferae]CVK96766.1 uncharacterized protein FMAN_11095 [Fusarium mangiferae]
MSAVVDAAVTKSEALKAYFMQWAIDISKVKSPEEEYKQKRQMLRHKFDNELHQLLQLSSDQNEYTKRSEAMLQHAGELKELEIQFKKSIALDEQKFGERLEAAHRRLACGLFRALGDTLWDHSVSTALNECLKPQRPKVDAVSAKEYSGVLDTRNGADAIPDTTIDLERDNQGLRHVEDRLRPRDQITAYYQSSTEMVDSAFTGSLEQQQSSALQVPLGQEAESGAQIIPATEEAEVNKSQTTRTPGPAPTPDASRSSDSNSRLAENSNLTTMPISPMSLKQTGGATHRDTGQTSNGAAQPALSITLAHTQNNTSPGQLPADTLVAHLRAPLKRVLAEASDQQQKRKRLHINSPDPPEERVIEFDQVFQNGDAQTKYIIVQHPPDFGHWYILECKEHGKHFHKDPIRSASRHLIGQDHGLNGDHSFAVKMLGTRVLHCNDLLAAMNNRIARQSFPEAVNVIPQRVTRGKRMLPQDYQAQGCEVIPVAGEIYSSKSASQGNMYPVLVLPWKAFHHFPQTKQLLNSTPSCYVFDKKVDQYPRGWAEGYEDGGVMLQNRSYPVVSFDKEDFPDQCTFGWAPLTSFKVYDPDHTSVVQSGIVNRYLRRKDPRLAVDYRYSTDQSNVIPDRTDGENIHMGDCME